MQCGSPFPKGPSDLVADLIWTKPNPLAPRQLPPSPSRRPAPHPPPTNTNQKPRIPQIHNHPPIPVPIRDRINCLLDDGLCYAQIIQQLGSDASGLKPDHIRRWKSGGYQDYLREQRLLQQCLARTTRALALLARPGHIPAFQATQQIATAQICHALTELGSDVLREALAANPLNYFRMLNSFSRLTTGGLKCERLLDEQAQTAAQEDKTRPESAPKKGLSPDTLKEMNDKLRLL
jgi:hypothetical protein